jgi:hypothetical protein
MLTQADQNLATLQRNIQVAALIDIDEMDASTWTTAS